MDGEKLTNFFLFHVEKMILVVVLGAAGFMIYSGLQKEDIRKQHQPDNLVNQANQVRASVDENHNDMVLKDRIPTFNIPEQIAKRTTPVPEGGYAKLQQFDPPISGDDIPSSVRRKDPRLAPAKALLAKGVLTTLAFRSPDGVYPLADLDPADPVEKVEKKEPVVRETRSRGRGRRGGGGEEGMGMEMDMMEMEMDEEMMGMDEEMMGMDSSGMAGANGPNRKFAREGDFGLRPTATKNLKTGADQPPVPGVGWFIAGTAVVPYKEIYQSYRDALSEADDYRPANRDVPLFRGYELQRADVTEKSVDALVEDDWIKRDGRTETTYDAILSWSGFAPELVASEYRVDSFLTMWIPPVLLDDYSTFALHPLVPMKTPAEILREEQEKELANQDHTIDEGELILNDDAVNQGMEQQMDMGGGMEMDMEMGGMEMGGMSGGRGTMMMAIDRNPVEYKLVRFYDFAIDRRGDKNAPKPGRKYVYRLRYGVIDPNFPKDPRLQPKGSLLAPDVYTRFRKKAADAEKTNKRDYIRWSDWSAPSEVATLPGREEYYAGPFQAAAPKPVRVGNRMVPFQAEPPTGKLVVSQFNTDYGTKMAVTVDVTEGTVLSTKLEKADIVDPITLDVKKVPEPTIISGSTVIDMDGGTPMTIHEGEDMIAPGLMLLFDQNGGLKVHDEVGDQEFYRIKSFADERGE